MNVFDLAVLNGGVAFFDGVDEVSGVFAAAVAFEEGELLAVVVEALAAAAPAGVVAVVELDDEAALDAAVIGRRGRVPARGS